MYVRFRKGRQDLTGVKIWFDFQGYYQTRFVFTVNLLKKQKQGEDTTQTSLGNERPFTMDNSFTYNSWIVLSFCLSFHFQ